MKSVLGILLLFLLLAPIVGFAQAPCFVIAIISFKQFFFNKTSPLPLRWMILFIASLQWGVAPALTYATDPGFHFKYRMYVDAGTYFSVATPGIIALALGLLLGNGKRDPARIRTAAGNLSMAMEKYYRHLPFLFIGIGFAAVVLGTFIPRSLAFAVVLLAQLKFAGLLLLIVSKRPDKKLWIGGVLFLLLLEAATTSLFHTILIWMTILGVFFFYWNKVRNTVRIGALFVMLVAAFLIQTIKLDYRAQAWVGGASGASVFVDMAFFKLGEILYGEAELEELALNAIIRVNQGWIISAVIDHTPVHEPFAEGETVQNAVLAALVPRLLWPNKPTAGGRDAFTRFTGMELGRNTSMNISILGESYANFGIFGAPIAVFLFGLTLSLTIRILVRICVSKPILIVLLPIALLQALKAETDFVTVINHVIKASISMLVITYVVEMSIGRRRRARPMLKRTPTLPRQDFAS